MICFNSSLFISSLRQHLKLASQLNGSNDFMWLQLMYISRKQMETSHRLCIYNMNGKFIFSVDMEIFALYVYSNLMLIKQILTILTSQQKLTYFIKILKANVVLYCAFPKIFLMVRLGPKFSGTKIFISLTQTQFLL